MILESIKIRIDSLMGKKCKFVFHGSRNQKDIFEGVVVKKFPKIFIVKSIDGFIKSYSYADVLISALQIIY